MNEVFVTYEIAAKLKEKGFKEECLAYYTTDIDFFYNTTLDSEVVTGFKSFNSNPNSICGKRVDAPTISQVLKWLREEKKIYVALDFYRFNGNTEIWWTYSVRYIEDDSTENIFESCKRKSWEQASIAGIEYVIDNLI